MNPATGNGKVRISYPPPIRCHLKQIEIEIIGELRVGLSLINTYSTVRSEYQEGICLEKIT